MKHYISFADNGKPYVEHSLMRNHKYIDKIQDGRSTRYFYTQQELDAYRNRGRQSNIKNRPTSRNVYKDDSASSSIYRRDIDREGSAYKRMHILAKEAKKHKEYIDEYSKKAKELETEINNREDVLNDPYSSQIEKNEAMVGLDKMRDDLDFANSVVRNRSTLFRKAMDDFMPFYEYFNGPVTSSSSSINDYGEPNTSAPVVPLKPSYDLQTSANLAVQAGANATIAAASKPKKKKHSGKF